MAVVVFNSRNRRQTLPERKGAMCTIRDTPTNSTGSMQHVVLGPVVSGAQGPKTTPILFAVAKLEIARRGTQRASEVPRPSHRRCDGDVTSLDPYPGRTDQRGTWTESESDALQHSGLPRWIICALLPLFHMSGSALAVPIARLPDTWGRLRLTNLMRCLIL